jgi:HEAT repeat protein
LQAIGPPAVTALLEVLNDNNIAAALSAVNALEGIGPLAERASPALIALVENHGKATNSDIQGAAAKALARIKPTSIKVLDALAGVLRQGAPNRDRVRLLRDVADALELINFQLPPEGDPSRMQAERMVHELVAQLSALLEVPDDDLRAAVAGALGALGQAAAPTVPKLAVFSTSPSMPYMLRAKAATALARIAASLTDMDDNARRAVKALVDALPDGDPQLQQDVADALKSLGPSASVGIDALTNLLGNHDEFVRRSAADALGAIGTKARSALTQLNGLLSGEQSELVLRSAADAVGLIGPDCESVRLLIKLTDVDHSWFVRKSVADALAAALRKTHAAESAVGRLKKWIKDDNWQVRLAAANALRQQPPREIPVEELRFLLLDNSDFVRQSAADGLAEAGEGGLAATQELVKALDDRSCLVRNSAARALGKIGADARAAGTSLNRLVEDPHWEVRRSATRALAEIGPGAESVEILIRCCTDKDLDVRGNALWALKRVNVKAFQSDSPDNQERAVERLFQALAEERTREAAAVALANLASTLNLEPKLRARLQHNSSLIRQGAALAFGLYGPESALDALAEAVNDSDEGVRVSAGNAMAKICKKIAHDGGSFHQISLALTESERAVATLKRLSLAREPSDPEKKVLGALEDGEHSLEKLREDKLGPVAKLREFLGHHWEKVLPVLFILLLPLTGRAFYCVWPTGLLDFGEWAQRFVEKKLNQPKLGMRARLLRWLLEHMHAQLYGPRVLDRWVTRNLSLTINAMQSWELTGPASDTVLRVRLDGFMLQEKLVAKDLLNAFRRPEVRIVIRASDGAAAQRVASRIARWVIDEDQSERPCEERMLPIVLSHEDLQAPEKEPVNNAVRRVLQKKCGLAFLSKVLSRELSKNKRILIVVMGDITQLDSHARMQVEQELFTRVNALVVTTSQDTTFKGTDRTFIEVARIEDNPGPLGHPEPASDGTVAQIGDVALLVLGGLSLLSRLRRG